MDLTLAHPTRETQKGLPSAEMEPTRGLEPLTTCLQDRCATDCATSADPRRSTGRAHPGGWAREMLPALQTPGGHPRAPPPPEATTPAAQPGSDPAHAEGPDGDRRAFVFLPQGEQEVPLEPGAAGRGPTTSLQSAVAVEPALQRTHRGRVERAGTVLVRVDVALERAHRLGADDAVRRGTDLALQGGRGDRAEDTVLGGADPALDRPDGGGAEGAIHRDARVVDGCLLRRGGLGQRRTRHRPGRLDRAGAAVG